MNFTREPIIETIITPKEGFKLVLRNSSGNSQEEYSVSSVEVVSFGKSFFFRSLEKPKAFLLPVSDYEVLEVRETRSVLKKPKIEKSIKIGGGKTIKTKTKEVLPEEEESITEETKKRTRGKASRRRRPFKKDEKSEEQDPVETDVEELEASQTQRRTLLPPPTSLISEQINRYKDYLASEGAILSEEFEGGETEEKVEKLPKESSDDLSFIEQNDVLSQNPPMFDSETTQEDKIIELEEEAPHSPESDD